MFCGSAKSETKFRRIEGSSIWHLQLGTKIEFSKVVVYDHLFNLTRVIQRWHSIFSKHLEGFESVKQKCFF